MLSAGLDKAAIDRRRKARVVEAHRGVSLSVIAFAFRRRSDIGNSGHDAVVRRFVAPLRQQLEGGPRVESERSIVPS